MSWKLKSGKWCILLIPALLGFALAGQESHMEHHSRIELRKQKFLQYMAATAGETPSFYRIAALLALNQDIEKARRAFMKRLENPVGDMFYSLPLMGTYLHGLRYWTPEIHRKVRQVWKTYLPYRGDTENHWVMWHTALLLAAQTWPDLPGSEWANGRSSRENYDDALGFLNFWFETTSTIGQGEFDSPDYLPEYLAPLFLLYDFALDPELKLKAEMALNWLLADYAIDYLKGAYTGGHSRIYQPRVVDPLSDGALAFGYMLFGDTPFPRRAPFNFAVYAALSSYSLPPIIGRIARDRETPYVSRERKRVRNIIRFGKERNPPVYKYNYMTRNFSLGSLDGGLQQPIQIHTWDVTYVYDGGKVDNLFSLHPYYSALELAMFFPEPVKILVEGVVKSKKTYDKEDKWTGASPYERTFQHRNTIIVLYNLAEDTPYRHIDYYFPKSLTRREVDDSGWIFCQGGAAYIAVRPFRPGQWRQEVTNFRLRSPYLKNGHVTAVFDSSEFASWELFKDRIRATRLDLSELDTRVQVAYTTLQGDRMVFRFPDYRELNGRPLDLSKTPLFDSPYLQGNNGVLRITHGGETLILDFKQVRMEKRARGKK